MTIQTEFVLSLALLSGSMPFLCRSKKSRAWGVAYFALAEISAVLLIAHYAANQIMGEGLNEAALYHLRFGLRHAAYWAYSGLVIIGLAALVGSSLLFGFIAFRPQLRANKTALAAAFLLVGASLCVNPGLQGFTLRGGRGEKQSDLYQYYKAPYIAGTPSHAPQNIVFIYAEGFERTFFDEGRFPGLIKELRKLEAEGLSFTEINQVKGAAWTMGGIVASQCGIPLITPARPMGGNAMSGMDAFLPSATALSDLLKEQDYYLSFIGGANSAFAGKKDFLATHSFDEILGREELAQHLKDPTLLTHWGLYDESTFAFSLKRYRELAAGKKPFALFLLTLDTHYPNPVSPKVSSIKYGDGSNPMLNAVAASDSLIGEFVRELRAAPGGRDTLIIIASDHFAMFNPATPLLNAGKRRNLFLILDPRHQRQGMVGTPGTTLDIGATIIPYLGFKGALGLGRDLLDDGVSLDERRLIQSPDRQSAWEDDIMRFWGFPRITDHLEFDPKSTRIAINGRLFKAPMLIDLSDNLMTRFKFEFDASSDKQMLDQYIAEHAPGDPFILVTTRQRAKPLLPQITGPG